MSSINVHSVLQQDIFPKAGGRPTGLTAGTLKWTPPDTGASAGAPAGTSDTNHDTNGAMNPSPPEQLRAHAAHDTNTKHDIPVGRT